MSTYVSLYRKYRPQTFGDVVGQGHITRILQNALETGRIAHAYLFCGPRGTGKTTTARLLAKALNCASGPARDPCNACPACERVTAGSALDVREIDAASNRGIDDIRELREGVKYAPAEARYKVYVIDECHMLTTEAFNALLKTLEEPPAHVLFVLATTDPQKVPPTILSRCQRLDFRRGSVADLIRRLKVVAAGEEVDADEDALMLIARSADGSWRDALSILEQIVAFGARRVTAEDVRTILGTVSADMVVECIEATAVEDAARALQVVARLDEEGKDIRDFLRSLVAHLRNLLLVGTAGGAVMPDGATADEARVLLEQSQHFAPALCLRAIEALSDAEKEMRRDSQHRLLLEIALLRIVSGARLAPPRTGAEAATATAPAPPAAAKREAAGVAATPAAAKREAPRPRPAPTEETTAPPSGSLDRRESVPPAAPPPAETTPAAAETAPASDAGPLALEEVLARWPLIVDRVKNRLLGGVLRGVRPGRVSSRELVIHIPPSHTYHRDQLAKPDNRLAIEDAVCHVLGTRLTVRAELAEDGGGGDRGASDDAPPPQAAPVMVAEPAAPAPARAAAEPDPYDAETMSVKDVLDLFHGRLVQNKDDG